MNQIERRVFSEEGTRPPTRPLKQHAAAVEEFMELQQMLSELQDQASAINAIIAEKGKLAGSLESDLKKYAEEYRDRAIRVGKLLVYLQDIPERKSKAPQYKQAFEWALGRLASLGKDLSKEGQDFLEATKATVPSSKELRWSEVESSGGLAEAWGSLVRLLRKFAGIAQKSEQKLSSLEQVIGDKL